MGNGGFGGSDLFSGFEEGCGDGIEGKVWKMDVESWVVR
jgi:hypothetical protein